MKLKKLLATALAGSLLMGGAGLTRADDKAMIDANTERALNWLRASDVDTAQLLERAAGVLIFPDIVEMGFGVGASSVKARCWCAARRSITTPPRGKPSVWARNRSTRPRRYSS
ncbi:MAG: hypothetical protein R3E54_01865 [Halioglobus sp.]